MILLLLAGCAMAHPSTTLQRHSNQPAPGSSQPLRALGALGILFGAIETEAAIERRLERLVRDLDQAPVAQQRQLRDTITGTLERGRLAMHLLGTGLDLAVSRRSDDATGDYKRLLLARTQESPPNRRSANNTSSDVASVRRQIESQLAEMRRQLAPRLSRTVRHLGVPNLATSLGNELIQRLLAQTLPKAKPIQERMQSGLRAHVERIFRRQDTNEIAVSVDASGETTESESSEEEDGPGGLVGLIASLSGGDEGSDVGALIGSLSAVVTNLFGPGGLDVPGLLGTGTSLIAGLLGGDDNFGKVLGSYVGIAIEGLSGGGADMNGAFFGNFLGALIAALSSDPEDEDLPLRPKLFVENFFSGLEAAKRKADPNEDAEQCCQQKPGSDLFGFLGNVVSSVVGGVTSLILNASLGSSGGSSQGSADASGASSAGSSGDHPKA
ncbi:uncharacterized protein LOC128728361 [Anopheles nili]|uniref:uncharacterized protein LOC128728361 n=1 Tax=Anopheles nili TaxID=185578 RepID=UPI00237A828A|nr:uncharacterized protein LOC128728361 [Anopheles nili]